MLEAKLPPKQGPNAQLFDTRQSPWARQTDTVATRWAFCRSSQETDMAKGQMKSNKEAKRPKTEKDKPKAGASAYKLGQGKGETAVSSLVKKT